MYCRVQLTTMYIVFWRLNASNITFGKLSNKQVSASWSLGIGGFLKESRGTRAIATIVENVVGKSHDLLLLTLILFQF